MDTSFAGVNECDMPLTPQYFHKITGFSRAQYGKFPDIMKEDGKYGVPFYNMGLMLFTTKLLLCSGIHSITEHTSNVNQNVVLFTNFFCYL